MFNVNAQTTIKCNPTQFAIKRMFNDDDKKKKSRAHVGLFHYSHGGLYLTNEKKANYVT